MEEPSVGGGAAAADPASGGGTGPGASPWRKATPPPAASAETAVMGAESWPALEEARQKAALESPAKAGPGNAWWRLRKGAAPQGSPPPPPPSQVLYGLSSLKKLFIQECPCISRLPEKGLPPSLDKLKIIDCSAELNEKCRMLTKRRIKVEIDRGICELSSGWLVG